MQINQPDDTTGDSVTLARVHTFLAALLSFLGFGVLPTATIADMLDELTGWLEMAKSIRRDPQGATARIWWDAFKDAWRNDHVEGAARSADNAIAEFGKRFLPVNAEDDRDTLNTEDFNAMREELDKQTQIAAELRSERDVLLKANEVHARENLALHKRSMHTLNEIDAVISNALGLDEDASFNRINALVGLQKERDELRTKLASAIVPQPKPERVEPGQRYAILCTCTESGDVSGIDRFYHPSVGDVFILREYVGSAECAYVGEAARPPISAGQVWFKNGKLARVSHIDESLITVDTVISGEPKRAFVTHSDFATAIYLGTEAT
jgi:hypothetical protein